MRRFSEPVASTTRRHGKPHLACSAGHVPDATRNGARINTRSSSVSCPLRNSRLSTHIVELVLCVTVKSPNKNRWSPSMVKP
ncbi:hypothetical protein [Salmonella phage vB_StyS-sam]|uniref:Uncharacterized protein n=1 Tax=Salmonella phage vB_StyS-sam TaxID=2664131 RepID=A0A5K7YDI8_9CAUD|nr:hypothetical protein QA026_gp06 [Salmonella phage vB_StyS-sam]BBO65959.1 hypothetical protein [Salmonella phage vB_StyS-sam]